MSSGGSNYNYQIEDTVKKYKEQFIKSGYSIVQYDIEVNDFDAWICEKIEKLEKENKDYRSILDAIYIARVAMNNHRVKEILDAIDDYCYALGGGELTEEEIEQRIDNAWDRLKNKTK